MTIGYCRWAQRMNWKSARRLVHDALRTRQFERIPDRYPRHIRWDYW